MHIIVCLGNGNGMSFGGRRQSMDRAVRQDILENFSSLRMSTYSAGQFDTGNIVKEDNFLQNAQPGDDCFVENTPVDAYMHKVKKITVYRWNRDYPADLYFPSLEGYQCVERRDFSGYSHPTITKEVYSLCDRTK